jgi:hypothetical protein
MFAGRAVEGVISLELIGIVTTRLRRVVQHVLEVSLGAFPDHIPTHDTMGGSIYVGDEVNFVFLSPTKLYTIKRAFIT